MKLEQVPNEILLLILERVMNGGEPNDLKSAQLVSRRWGLLSSIVRYKSPKLERYGDVEMLLKLIHSKDNIFPYSRFIQKLEFVCKIFLI
jgi:hypothetical protein